MRKLFFLTAIVLCLVWISAIGASAQATETVLHSFTDGSDGGYPEAGLVFDQVGNLYGTTTSGGLYDQGAVFELSPSSGGWSETVLYNFTGQSDGGYPAAGLVVDESGSLFGTTYRGGSGYGTVFKLYRAGTRWNEIVLHNFGEGSDGMNPSGLSVDRKGRAFGTTQFGGTHGTGTVFGMQLSAGVWQYATLYSFGNSETDGSNPTGGVIVGKGERLYGTTQNGGYGRGTVFALSYTPSGWNEEIIYDFEGGYDGTTPLGGLVADSAGNLYGTTYSGGSYNDGTVFELSPSGQGWTKAIIYEVNNDLFSPQNFGALTFDHSGNLYGETRGTIFELTPSNGTWSESTFFEFNAADGDEPNGNLIADEKGNLYGTTYYGGNPFGVGVAFEITP